MRHSCGNWCRVSEVDLITLLFTHTCGALPGTAWWVCIFIVVQLLSRIWLFATPWTAAWQASLSFTISWILLRFMSIESVMLSNYLILCCPLIPLPSVFPASGSFPMSIQGWFPLGLTGLISLQSKVLSKVFSNTTVQKHQFFGAQLSSQSNSHIHTWPLEKP